MHPVERDGRDRQGGKAKTGENDQAGDQSGLCEQIADHGDLRIPFGWQRAGRGMHSIKIGSGEFA
jgi:hypothetical protein